MLLEFELPGSLETETFGCPCARKHCAYEFTSAAKFGEVLAPDPAGCGPPPHAVMSTAIICLFPFTGKDIASFSGQRIKS